MVDFNTARINTAGAYVCFNGKFVFTLGIQPHQGRIPVVRLGGHRLEHETAWQCAERELLEEANLRATLLHPSITYMGDGNHLEADLREIVWQPTSDALPAPLLVVAYQIDGKTLLSLMFLAQAQGSPRPASEVKGLILLTRNDIRRLCRGQVTLEEYLCCGGQAILKAAFDQNLVLEPFAQLRLLERILARDPASNFWEANKSA